MMQYYPFVSYDSPSRSAKQQGLLSLPVTLPPILSLIYYTGIHNVITQLIGHSKTLFRWLLWTRAPQKTSDYMLFEKDDNPYLIETVLLMVFMKASLLDLT